MADRTVVIYINEHHLETSIIRFTITSATSAQKTQMYNQETNATPAQAQADQTYDEHDLQWPQIPDGTTWAEHEALTNAASGEPDTSWLQEPIPCGGCFQTPCRCPHCRFCRSKLSGTQCACQMTACWNAARTALTQVVTTFGPVRSQSVQALSPLVSAFRPVWQQYHIYRCRQAVRAETDGPRGYMYVTEPAHVADMVTQLADLPTDKPNIGFDMEANNLGHNSELSYLQIRDYDNNISYLVDLLVLQRAAWKTTGADNVTTLKTIFEDPKRTKLIFDCRQDSACLYAKAGVKVRGIIDCQYLHMLTMDRYPTFRLGLAAAVRQMAGLSNKEWAEWSATKKSQRSHGIWEKRPVPAECKAYAVGDVEILRAMYDTAEAMLEPYAIELGAQWSAFEVGRTWCGAEKYTTIAGKTWERFALCWSCELLKEGVIPNPAPVERADAY
ncbi:hypothetical protein LTR70_000859 [Exophiala xenobiotica]|nr:hypothetical protein LTR70_000859 [Exophiala xenobiotica]